MSQDQVITIRVTVAEVNGILQALGNMPFNQVLPLITKLKEQAEAQLTTTAPVVRAQE